MVRRLISSPVGCSVPQVSAWHGDASAGIPPLGVWCHGQGPSMSELLRHLEFCTMDPLFTRVDCVACLGPHGWGWGGTRTHASDWGLVTLSSGRHRAAGA